MENHRISQPGVAFRRLTLFVIVITGVFLVQLAILRRLEQVVFRDARPDFSCFYAAGRIVADGQGSRLYDYATQGVAQSAYVGPSIRAPLLFNHPPFEAVFFASLSSVSYQRAYVLWYVSNCALVAVFLWLVAQHTPQLVDYFPYVILGVGAFYEPLMVALVQGQDSILLLLLFTTCYVFLKRRQDASAGAALAIALFKPQIVLPLVAFLLIDRRFRVLTGFVCTSLILLLASVAAVGWRGVAGYPGFLLAFDRLPPEISGAYPALMPNVRGAVYAALGRGSIPCIVGLSTALAFLPISTSFSWGPNDASFDARFSLMVIVASLISYHSYTHDLCVLLLPFLLVVNYAIQASGSTQWMLLVPLVVVFLAQYGSSNPQLVFATLIGLAAAIRLAGARERMPQSDGASNTLSALES